MDSLLVQYPYLEELLKGILGLSYTHVIMWLIGGLLIFPAVKYDYERLCCFRLASVQFLLTFRIPLQYPLNRVLKAS